MSEERDTAPDKVSKGGGRVAPCPKMDADRYMPYLSRMQVSEEDARAFLEALFHVMHGFVELSFPVKSIQKFFPEISEDFPDVAPLALEWEHSNEEKLDKKPGGDHEAKH